MLIRKDIWVFLVFGFAGMVFTLLRISDAFPAASMNISCSKAKAVEIAKQFSSVARFGKLDTTSVQFDYKNQESTFLQYELGIAKANKIMRHDVPIWFWNVRLGNGDSDDDFRAEIGTDGKLQAFERTVPANLGMYSVPHERAREIASIFASNALGIDLKKWKTIGDSQSSLEGRKDHSFVWENEDQDYAGGKMRVKASLSGNVLSSFSRYLHVPDAFTRKLAWLRAQNEVLAESSKIVILLFLFLMPLVFIRAWIKHRLRPKFAIVCGILAALFSCISDLNNLFSKVGSIVELSADSGLLDFVGIKIIACVLSSAALGAAAAIFFGAVESVYRSAFPQQAAMEKVLSVLSMRSPNFLNMVLLGIGLAGISFAYSVLFYLLGASCGLWLPLQITDVAVLSSFCPAWDAIAIGVKASVLEEFGCRIFMLAILQKITRSFWLANLLQAMIWGFAHCDYPVEPPYARGIELTIEGIFYGWIMRRYGFIPLLLSHCTYDMFLEMTPLFGSSSIADKISAAVAISPLVLLPTVSMLLIKFAGPVSNESVSNTAIIGPDALNETSSQPMQLPNFEPMPAWLIGLLSLFATVCAALYCIPMSNLDPEPILRADRQKAISIASEYFKREGADLNGMQKIAWLSDREGNSEELQYIYEQLGFKRAKEIEGSIEPRLIWNVDFFKPGDSSRFSLRLSPDGHPVGSSIQIADTARGATLEPLAAQKLVEDYLKKLDAKIGNNIKIVHVAKLKLPARTDYKFRAEIPGLKVKDAPFSIEVDLKGEHISGMSQGWIVPEHWHSGKDELKDKNMIRIAGLLCLAMFALSFGHWLLTMLKNHPINWRLVSFAAAIAGGAEVISQLNYQYCYALLNYDSSEPLGAHIVQIVISVLEKVLGRIFVAGFLTAGLSACFPGLIPSGQSFRKSFIEIFKQRQLWADATFLGLALAAAFASLLRLGHAILSVNSSEVPLVRLGFLCANEVLFPGVDCIVAAIAWSFLCVAIAALLLKWRESLGVELHHSLLALAIASALYFASDVNFSNFVVHVCTCIIVIGGAYKAVMSLGRGNLIAIFFAGYFWEVGSSLLKIIRNEWHIHQIDIALLGLFFLLPIIWAAWAKYAAKPITANPAVSH